MKKNACSKCKLLFEGESCPGCKANSASPNWKGRMIVIDSEKSEIAKKVGHPNKGEYAIKV